MSHLEVWGIWRHGYLLDMVGALTIVAAASLLARIQLNRYSAPATICSARDCAFSRHIAPA